MSLIALVFGPVLFFSPAMADEPEYQRLSPNTQKSPPSRKRNFSAPEMKSFTSKVKLLRSIQDETEVFFDSEKARGVYILPKTLKDYATYKARLQKSAKAGGPSVQVTSDEERRIESVEIVESAKKPEIKDDWDKL